MMCNVVDDLQASTVAKDDESGGPPGLRVVEDGTGDVHQKGIGRSASPFVDFL